MPVTWCNQDLSSGGQSEGAKRPSGGGGGGVGGGISSHGREIFAIRMKTAFSRTLKAIIRGTFSLLFSFSF